MHDRETARLFGAMRIGIGALMLVAPRWAARVWLGEGAERAAPAVRSVGGRELALGAGLLIALDGRSSPRGWLEAAAVADATDAVASLLAYRRLPRGRRLPLVLSASAAAALGVKLAASVDEQ